MPSRCTGKPRAGCTAGGPGVGRVEPRSREDAVKTGVLRLVLLLAVLGASCSSLRQSDETLSPFRSDGKWGYRDAAGEVAISPRYVLADSFLAGGIAPVVDDTGWAYIDKRGSILLRPFTYDNGPDYFSEGLARFVEDGRFGFFDEAGRIVIAARFDFALPFHEGLAAFCVGCWSVTDGEHTHIEGGKWGYVDRSGRVVIPPTFDSALNFKEGTAEVELDGEPVIIDKKGTVRGKPRR